MLEMREFPMSKSLEVKVSDFLSQQNIAIAGVSRTEHSSAANLIYRRFRDQGYQVYAINPNADEVEGDTCYRSLKAIPRRIDGVVIVTPPKATEQVVHDCAERGIKRVWMHNGMHSAVSSVSEEAVEFCEQHDITVIAGACPMMFGKTSDGGHRFIKLCYQLAGRLPA